MRLLFCVVEPFPKQAITINSRGCKGNFRLHLKGCEWDVGVSLSNSISP